MSAPPSTPDPTPLEVPPWLKSLPLAPEYYPTLAEFQDPINYILKIEKEASTFGICKIIPPLPPPPKKTTLSNLNKSFAARNPKKEPTFTTRQQQIGFCPRRPRPVQKPVWQSGENYTLQQFEAKAKQFEKIQMKKFNKKNPFLPLEVESLFWRACADKPFSVEYANDIPGSGFAGNVKKWSKDEEAGNVGECGWNMRGVSRAKGSLLKYMKEEVPGVTSPMVYIAMMFSWFAWHVEDHELHSLNYLHFGAGKTWYGVPRDARQAFEEVVRVHGYGGEVNPLVTFTILGEKTTVMSPEVLIGAGIPCCRLVQNAGEFVVTFPGAYHCGFSHGYNCAEAANISTPGWLKVAKEAAIRRASVNYPPMVSHFQLLYALALSLCTGMPLVGVSEPRSSRLKDKMRGEGETMVKEIFVQTVIETNELLNALIDKGSSCIVLPQNTKDNLLYLHPNSKLNAKPKLSLDSCIHDEPVEVSRIIPSDLRTSDSISLEKEKEYMVHSDGLLDRGLLSCVTCGILSFTCVAIVQPSETAALYLLSADCGFLNNHTSDDGYKTPSSAGQLDIRASDRANQDVENGDHNQSAASALTLLASVYGDSSDSEEDTPQETSFFTSENSERNSLNTDDCDNMIKSRCESHIEAIQIEMLEDNEEERQDAEMGNMTYVSNAATENLPLAHIDTFRKNLSMLATSTIDKDSSRNHVFCLGHALEAEKLLHSIGGVSIMLLCHPDYPKIEEEARTIAEELENDYKWKDINFKEASEKDLERIRASLEDEESIPTSSDWAVKLGINLYYSASLSKSPLYSKQLPYNAVIYRSFGCSSSNDSPIDNKVPVRRKKIVVAGKWCGKVWMSNQVHPFLAQKQEEEHEKAKKIHYESDTDTNTKIFKTNVRNKRSIPKRNPSMKRKMQSLVKENVKKTKEMQVVESSSTSRVLRRNRKANPRYENKLDDDEMEEAQPSKSKTIVKKQVEKIKKKKKKIDILMKEDEDEENEGHFVCDIDQCSMSFRTKKDLALHKKDICPEEGCGKKFFCHKYLVQHRKVHLDDRPLGCPWKGCKMRFKWPWARTEHIRVHTGDRPYICRECSQTFRFVSDFSRHKRKTGHVSKKGRR